MDTSWITTSFPIILIVFLTAVGIYIAVIIFTRIIGLRSFSKMSSFDFAITIAIGALVANVIVSPQISYLQGVVALASLYSLQVIVNYFRNRSAFFSRCIDNDPLLLMNGSEILEQNLKKARIERKELRHKLREANVTQLTQIKAVVLESTGDVSVLHHSEIEHKIDPEILKGVQTGQLESTQN